MPFNPSKCSTISVSRKHKKISNQYILHSQPIEHVDTATYLAIGVELSEDLTWSKHINKTTRKANRKLSFVRRNLQISSEKIKEAAYKGLVRPVLEYCAPIWDPHHQKYIDQLEMVQRRAARFTLHNYDYRSFVMDMLKKL